MIVYLIAVVRNETLVCVEGLQKLSLEALKCVHKMYPSYMNNMFEVMDLQYDLRDPYPVREKPSKTITYRVTDHFPI